METVAVEHDRRVAYERWGDLDGRPMFFLHGTPGCRLNRHPDATLWPSLGLHVITIDRPGYGESTALPGRRVSHAAGDVAAVADALGLGRFLVVGSSGGGPHALACAAELGHRVLACAAVASAAPLLPGEVEDLIGVNRKSFRIMAEHGRPGMVDFLGSLRDQFLADPVGALEAQLADAPSADIEWNQREDVQTVRREAILEALRPGVQGWVDDSVSIFGDDWNVDLGRVNCPVRFWHSDDDKNGPLAAVQRLVDSVPGASLSVWSGEGHSAPARNMEQFLGDLLDTARGED
ncbi:MAG TPA: alpha/beta hydrolase [Solirubrobacteraceae bacterium]|nr:alpha/beta hydrolase [Solirubrobacteraceae bacterium]